MYKRDGLIILFVFSIAVFIYVIITPPSPEKSYAVISVYNHPDIPLDLTQDKTFILPQNTNVLFQIKNGKIAFISSDCPDKICVNTGFIHKPGQSAACLPNRVLLTVR